MLLLNVDYHVELVHFPSGCVKETVVPNEDDSYTIFIESTLSREQQEIEFLHAMKHIMGDDFSKENLVDSLEKQAHYT